METVRLKSMRDGIEDYELLSMAEARLGRDAVREQIKPFIRSAWDFDDDYQTLQNARIAIGRSLT